MHSLLRNRQDMLKGDALSQQHGQLLSRQIPEWLTPSLHAPFYQAAVPIRLNPRVPSDNYFSRAAEE